LDCEDLGKIYRCMNSKIKSFGNFINEFWSGPGTVEVPGAWYKDNVNSRNYRPANTQLPQVVDTMYGSTDLYSYMDSLSEEREFADILEKNHKNPKDIIKYLKKRIGEELSFQSKSLPR